MSHSSGVESAPRCSNCRRFLPLHVECGGPERFCSSQCSAYFYGTAKASESPNCGIPNCFVCSGAMRERAGKGDDTDGH